MKLPSNNLIAAPALPSGSAGKKIGYRNPLWKSVPYLNSLIKKTRSQPVGQPPGKRTNIRLVATLSI
nr:MAG TPA: hypothetical protein [Caudoviricetes sp.]